jgi:hypothetical protein
MRPIIASVGPLAAASANNISLSQTPAGAGALTLNGSLISGGVATLDNPRRVLITTADTTHAFTVTGATPTGAAISEVVGPIATGTAYTAQDFKTVTSVTINGGATAAVTVGTNGVASTPWVRLDEWANPHTSIQCNVAGTVNYTVQFSNDDPNDPTNPVIPSAMAWINTNDPNGVAAVASILTNLLFTSRYVRTLLNSGTGSVAMTVIQAGVANR